VVDEAALGPGDAPRVARRRAVRVRVAVHLAGWGGEYRSEGAPQHAPLAMVPRGAVLQTVLGLVGEERHGRLVGQQVGEPRRARAAALEHDQRMERRRAFRRLVNFGARSRRRARREVVGDNEESHYW